MKEKDEEERSKEEADKESVVIDSLSNPNPIVPSPSPDAEGYGYVSEDDDPVEIAVKVFRGSPLNRWYWRWYYDMMIELEADVYKAMTLFTEWAYFKHNELVKDKTPDTNALHARAFHTFLRGMFNTRYGRIRRKNGIIFSAKQPR